MYSCDVEGCTKTFARNHDVTRHKKTVHNENKWTCDDCGKDFPRKDKLRDHKKAVHEHLSFNCDECEKTFSRKDKLKNHKRSAHGPAPVVSNPPPPKHPRLPTSWTVIQKKNALRNALRSIEVKGEGLDPLVYLQGLVPDIEAQVGELLEEEKGLKVSFCLQVEFQKPTEPAVKKKAHFWCKQTVVNRLDVIKTKVDSCFPEILKGVEDFTSEGSGWAIQRILSCELHFCRYRALRGSKTIDLPAFIKHKRAVINIHNVDEKCFLWSVIASHPRFDHLVHRECVDLYKPYEEELNMKGIELPMARDQIPKFEKQNDITINVNEYDYQSLSTLYISELTGSRHVNLLLHEGHYFWIRNLDRLLGDQRRDKHKKFFCHRCLFPFFKQERLDEHVQLCKETNTRIEMSKKPTIQFENVHKQLRQPVVVYADFECLLEPMEPENEEQRGSTEKYQRHVPCGYGLIQANSCCGQSEFGEYDGYRGPDTVRKFLLRLEQIGLEHQEKLDHPAPLQMSSADESKHCSNTCHICKTEIGDPEDKVRDHCHMCGRYRGPAHNACNQGYRLNRDIVVVFHNLRRYDGHLIMRELGPVAKDLGKELNCVAKAMEDYLSFRVHTPKCNEEGTQGWSMRFIDSFQFLSSSLDQLVKSMPPTEFTALDKEFKDFQDNSLLLRKGVYPYDYMDTPARFQETQLPPKAAFHNKLNDEDVTDDDYAHAQRVWDTPGIRNLGDYHDHYLKSDTCQLADVIERFRGDCMEHYGLDPMHYITLPSFAWDACLKITGVKLETIQDPDMYKFFEDGIRGGMAVIIHRYARANNPKCPWYDPTKPTTYLLYIDANNLYGWAMIQKLPIRSLRWLKLEDLLHAVDWANTTDGYVLEVDLEYPAKLHDEHNDYPLAPEKIAAPGLSPYCQELKDQLGLGKCGVKLIPNLQPKTKYIIHIRNLQQCLSLGMKLTAVHRVVAFEEEAWMEPYIMLNTRLRTAATTDLAKNLFKLMNNAVFGKTMENPRAYQDFQLVTSDTKAEKLIARPRFKRSSIFTPDLVGILMSKPTTVLDKPIYCGFTVLEASKTLMYDYHYNYVLKRYPHPGQVKLLFTDTDSFIYQIQTPDVYADMLEDRDRFDTSGYPKDHPLYSTVNKKVIGKMSDELDGTYMLEFCGLRAKMYNFVSEKGENPKAKGIKKATVKRIPFSDYTESLFTQCRYTHKMNLLRSEKHQIHSVTLAKSSLSPFDDKRYILDDGVTTLAYGNEEIDLLKIPLAVPMDAQPAKA